MFEDLDTFSGYSRPPRDILDVMHAPSSPIPILSPTHDRILLRSFPNYPSLERVAAPYMRLAGVRVEPHNHNRRDIYDGSGIMSYANSCDLVHVEDGSKIRVALPENACMKRPVWSADGKQYAFENVTPDAVEVWVGNGQTGAIRRVPNACLNPMLKYSLQWMPDQKTLLVKLVPAQAETPPAKPAVPTGPSIQESDGKEGHSSSYEARDVLTCKHDEDLFDYYAASQLAFIDSSSLAIQPVGEVDRYLSVAASPDGQKLLVMAVRKPYSYLTTYDRFPYDVAVWNILNHSIILSQSITSLPLADRIPVHGVRLGPRGISWRENASATLIWAEALDEGDWKVDVPARDKVMSLKAPFNGAPVEIARTEHRFRGYVCGEHPDLALLYESDRNRRWQRIFIVNIDKPQQARRLLWDFSIDEKYEHPGNVVYKQIANGFWVLHQSGDSIFLSGKGSSPDGDRPFLDCLDLKTLTSQRLFRSSRSSYEKFLGFEGVDTRTFLTCRESPSEPRNIFRRKLQTVIDAPKGEAIFSSDIVAITHIPDPAPVVRKITKRLVNYKRGDGTSLSFQLHTPPGYQEGTRVPTILYAYPLDYADASQAGQISGSHMTFTVLQEYQFLLLAGYAILDKASFPVVGDPKMAYDTYLEQLVANAEAAVAEAVRLGVADPDRIGVTGHSHGALMAANLLAHSRLFRAGVATSGSYNKTLSPFGFQTERRSVWEALDVYRKVSPFFAADKMKSPLLLIHGADDANPGTTPLQSSNFYQAIRANGGLTRLVLLPHEPHWYTAKESNEQLVYEMLRWFDKYVKNSVKLEEA